MKLIKTIIAAAVLAAGAAPLAQAVTIDARHEMKDTGRDAAHRDRLAISHRFANGIGFSSEVKFKAADKEDHKPFNDYGSNGTEIGLSYQIKTETPFTYELGALMENSSSAAVYKPYVRASYKFTDDLSSSLRYRPYYKRVGDGKPSSQDEKGEQITWATSYKLTKVITISTELDWKKSHDVILAAGKKDRVEADMKIAYKWDANWSPYAAIGNVPGGDNMSNERQTRYRVGVAYSF